MGETFVKSINGKQGFVNLTTGDVPEDGTHLYMSEQNKIDLGTLKLETKDLRSHTHDTAIHLDADLLNQIDDNTTHTENSDVHLDPSIRTQIEEHLEYPHTRGYRGPPGPMGPGGPPGSGSGNNEALLATNEPTGFPNQTDSVMSWEDVDPRTFRITPTGASFDIWQQTVKYTISGDDEIQITDVSGTHVIYYELGILTEVVNPSHPAVDSLIINNPLVAIIYWNATDSVAYILSDERHGIIMDGQTHEYLHATVHSVYVSGESGLSASGYILNTKSDAALKFDVSNGFFYDEDIGVEIADGLAANQYKQVLIGDAEIPVLYRDGVGGMWKEQAASILPYINNGDNTNLNFNLDIGGTWSQEPCNNTKFVIYTLIATNDWQHPIKMVQGNAEYITKAEALAAVEAEQVAWGDLPVSEIIILYRFTLQTGNYAGIKNAQIVDVTDFRTSTSAGVGASVSSHPSLSSLPWVGAGHTGATNTFAGFDGSGAATVYPVSDFALASDVLANENAIAVLTSDLVGTRADVATNTSDIVGLRADVDTNTSDLVGTRVDVAENAADIVVLTSDLVGARADTATNTADIIVLTSDLVGTRVDVAVNTSDIVGLRADVDTNTSDLVGTRVDVAANTSDIIVLQTGVAANTSDILTHDIEITANTSDIVTLQNAVAVNTSDIIALQSGSSTSGTFCFITGATGDGEITGTAYEADTIPSDKVLTDFTSDNDAIVVNLEMHVLSNVWQPDDVVVSLPGATSATVLKNAWTQVDDTRIFTATASIADAGASGTITATMSDGDTSTCEYTRDLDPPLVLTAIFDSQGASVYPAAQTQCKENDTMDISGTTEAHADEVWVIDNDLTNTKGLQGPFAVAAGVWSGTINVGSSTDSTSFYTCYAKVTGGANGDNFVSDVSVDKDQTSPTFGSPSITYQQSGAEALKGTSNPNADATVTLTHSNIQAGDTYLYADIQSELTIGNSVGSGADLTTYQATKWVRRYAGNYRDDDDSTNYRLTVTRTTKNGKSASSSTIIEIAHATPTVAVYDSTGTSTPDRMGTDNGDNSYRDYLLYIAGNQKHLSTSTSSMANDSGDTADFTGAFAKYGNDYRTRATFRVEDGDINAGGQAANNFTWESITFTNRAKTVATTITTNDTYQIGGFQARTLTIPAWTNREADIGVFAVDTGNLLCENLSKGGDGANGGTDFTFDNSPGSSTPDDGVDKFCITNGSDVVDDDGQFWYNKDLANAQSNSLGTATVIVEETAS